MFCINCICFEVINMLLFLYVINIAIKSTEIKLLLLLLLTATYFYKSNFLCLHYSALSLAVVKHVVTS